MLSLILAALLALAEPPPPPPATPPPVVAPVAPLRLSVTGPAEVPEYKFVRLAAADAEPDSVVIWDVTPDAQIDSDESPAGFTFTAPPGVYAVKVRSISTATRRVQTARLTVTITPRAPPAPTPGPNPPAPPAGLYFALVRPDGAGSPDFVRAVSLPEWDALRKLGHSVKDFEFTTAVKLLGPSGIPAGTTLPCVVTLRSTAAGSTILRGPAPLPATGAEVLDLPKGVQ